MTKLLDLDSFTRAIDSPAVAHESAWRAQFVRLRAGELARLTEICRQYHLRMLDTIERQLADLALVRWPAMDQADARRRFIADRRRAHGGGEAYGNWVWLPWEAKLVHLLDEDDYFEVITNRNQDKITREEQLRLRTKRVGVVGLSVGGEAAVTVAQEHLCGEIVLADFDRLDLSNLNRLNAGFDELGVAKVKIAARRILRINPYLRVTIFEEGVTAENMQRFLDGLDLLIEECDGLQIKRDIRLLARERRLNIVYAADERGFLSVEPYQHWPDLRPFHGRAEQAQPPREAFATPLEFMRALALWLGGWDNLSERSRDSLERLGAALCGYPQLASEARYAAGQIGHVARRLLLGEPLPPFLGNFDLSELLTARG
ncbi:MAG TPA: ThiF family adenylyltransferase [Blastocatellia bacterium]|nr:ThiF family adenylyltransferase [Blastocatellia bacterium]